MSRPEPAELARQIGRHWESRTALGVPWAFVEADSDEPGNIYACSLPELLHRREEAASIVVTGTSSADPISRLTAIGLRVLAAAPTATRAMQLLADLTSVLTPEGRRFVEPATLTMPSGLIGPPSPAQGHYAAAWRVIDLVIERGPEPIGDRVYDQRSAEGQSLASMDIRVEAVEYLVQG